jgi:hypothetical protein
VHSHLALIRLTANSDVIFFDFSVIYFTIINRPVRRLLTYH